MFTVSQHTQTGTFIIGVGTGGRGGRARAPPIFYPRDLLIFIHAAQIAAIAVYIILNGVSYSNFSHALLHLHYSLASNLASLLIFVQVYSRM